MPSHPLLAAGNPCCRLATPPALAATPVGSPTQSGLVVNAWRLAVDTAVLAPPTLARVGFANAVDHFAARCEPDGGWRRPAAEEDEEEPAPAAATARHSTTALKPDTISVMLQLCRSAAH